MQIKHLTAMGSAVVFAGVILAAATYSKPTKAVGATAPTGACGGAFSFSRKGRTVPDGYGVTALAYINFDTRTIELQTTARDETPGPGKGYKTEALKTTTFTIAQGSMTGSYLITPVADAPKFNLLPVNGGNTFLVQVIDDDTVGMCQKI